MNSIRTASEVHYIPTFITRWHHHLFC